MLDTIAVLLVLYAFVGTGNFWHAFAAVALAVFAIGLEGFLKGFNKIVDEHRQP